MGMKCKSQSTPEFKNLIPALLPEEFNQLEANIVTVTE